MVIEGPFYRITPCEGVFYDLELVKHIKGKNPRDEYQVVAYGATMESVLSRLVKYSTEKELPETVTLEQYLKKYKENVDKFRSELHKIIGKES